MKDFWKDAEIISGYSRAQAIEDGVLVNLMQPETEALVRNAGITVPVAMTSTAFGRYVWPIDNDEPEAWLKEHCQDLNGRLWDILWLFRHAIQRCKGDTLLFEFVVQDWQTRRQITAQLKSVIGPGDNGEPVITLMLPDED